MKLIGYDVRSVEEIVSAAHLVSVSPSIVRPSSVLLVAVDMHLRLLRESASGRLQ